MRSSLFWDVTQSRFEFSYGRFGIIYRPHLHRSSSPRRKTVSLVKMGSRGCPETSVTDYQFTLRKIAEERRCQLSTFCVACQSKFKNIYQILKEKDTQTGYNQKSNFMSKVSDRGPSHRNRYLCVRLSSTVYKSTENAHEVLWEFVLSTLESQYYLRGLT
jgi:hypothetical protein